MLTISDFGLSSVRSNRPELPVHVVLVPPLLVPPPSPAVMVTKNLDFNPDGHSIVQSMLHLSFFWTTGGIQARTFIRQTHRNEVDQDTLLSILAGYTVEGKSSVCLICMKYRIIFLIIIIISLGQILLSYIANTSRTHARMYARTYACV